MKDTHKLWQVAADLQGDVDALLKATELTEWDENHLSILLVQSIREAFQYAGAVEVPSGLVGLHAEAYKVTGTVEQTHGDIAVVVRHIFANGPELRGIGFYEAKASDSCGRYPAFKRRQLQRLLTSTPKLTLLLYEQTRSYASSDPFATWMNHERRPDDWLLGKSVHTRALGANIVLGMRDPRLAADFYAEPFAFHLLSRYLSGRDLDYSRPPLESLERWLKVTRRAPPIIVVLTVVEREQSVPLLEFPGYEVLPPLITPPTLSPSESSSTQLKQLPGKTNNESKDEI